MLKPPPPVHLPSAQERRDAFDRWMFQFWKWSGDGGAGTSQIVGTAPIAVATGTGSFTVSHNTSGVAAGTFGNSSAIPQLAVDARGHITSGTNVAISLRVVEGTSPIAVSTSTSAFTVSHGTSGVVAGTYGGTSSLASVVVDALGHLTGGTSVALSGVKLSAFAATTSAELAGVISDETGSGALVFAASPTFTGTIIAAALTASGLITANAGATIASGQTLALSGATVAGAPTWSSGQTMPSLTADGLIKSDAVSATGHIGMHITSATGGHLLFTDAGSVDMSIGVLDGSSSLTFFTGRNTASAGTELMRLTSAGVLQMDFSAAPGTLSATGMRLMANATYGAVLQGYGSTYDAFLLDHSGNFALGVLASTGVPVVPAGIYIVGVADSTRISSISRGASSVTLYIGNASINVTSDIRIKRDITLSILDTGAILDGLEVKDFYYADPSDKSLWNRNSRGRHTGLVAQQAIKFVPWLVNAEDRYCPTCLAGRPCEQHTSNWGFDYAGMVPVLVKELQHIRQRLLAKGI